MFVNHVVSKAKDVLDTLRVADNCEGNSDERFLELPNIHKNCMKDSTGVLCAKVLCRFVNFFAYR